MNSLKYASTLMQLLVNRKIDLQTAIMAMRERPAAVSGRVGIDPIDPNCGTITIMLEAEFLSNGCLRVIQITHSFSETKRSFSYYDLDKNLQSYTGKEGETPSLAMTPQEVSWVRAHYVPLAQWQMAARDAQAAVLSPQDPNRFEKARRWATLVTASLVSDGSYDKLTRDQIKAERTVRYQALEAASLMPSDREIAVANDIIAGREGPLAAAVDHGSSGGNDSKTAKELATRYGHTNSDSNTTLKSEVNTDASDGHDEMMDLNVYGHGDAAYFQWTTEYGDPIGDSFHVVDIQDEDLPHLEYVIYSCSEANASGEGAGFWNNRTGWTEFLDATKFTEHEMRSLSLPNSAGQDATWERELEVGESFRQTFRSVEAQSDDLVVRNSMG